VKIGHVRTPVFVSYAHEDNEPPDRWLDRFLQMLKPLQLNNAVCAWSDRDIRLGDDWASGISLQLDHYVEAAVLLVSPAYLASDFIRNGELPVLLRRYQENGLLVIPIVLRHCFFSEATFKYPDPSLGPECLPLSVFQAANSPQRPLDTMARSEQDAVFINVGRRLLEAHEAKLRASSTSNDPEEETLRIPERAAASQETGVRALVGIEVAENLSELQRFKDEVASAVSQEQIREWENIARRQREEQQRQSEIWNRKAKERRQRTIVICIVGIAIVVLIVVFLVSQLFHW
jgi:hypothetical protein